MGIDGRSTSGNDPVAVLCRLKSEIAYTRERKCLRPGAISKEARDMIDTAYGSIEAAIRFLENQR